MLVHHYWGEIASALSSPCEKFSQFPTESPAIGLDRVTKSNGVITVRLFTSGTEAKKPTRNDRRISLGIMVDGGNETDFDFFPTDRVFSISVRYDHGKPHRMLYLLRDSVGPIGLGQVCW